MKKIIKTVKNSEQNHHFMLVLNPNMLQFSKITTIILRV